MKKLLIAALVAALPSLAALNVQAQEAGGSAASAPKVSKEDRKAAREKRQAEMKASLKKEGVKDPALAGNEVKPAPGAASSAERKAARKEHRKEMADTVKKNQIPNPDAAPK
jgi:hypothetical protein